MARPFAATEILQLCTHQGPWRRWTSPAGASTVHAGLCTHVDEYGPLPLFGHTVDGNQNGHTAVAEQFALIRKHLKPAVLTMISDRGTFSAGHLRRLKAEGFHAILARAVGRVAPLFDRHRQALTWKEASFLSIEQQCRCQANRSMPREHYELAVLKHELVDAESNERSRCRVVFVFSTADRRRPAKATEKTDRQAAAGIGGDPAQRGHGRPQYRCNLRRQTRGQGVWRQGCGPLLPVGLRRRAPPSKPRVPPPKKRRTPADASLRVPVR